MRFEDMDVWKKSSRLSVNIYRHLADLKDFGFKDQISVQACLYLVILPRVLDVLRIKISVIF